MEVKHATFPNLQYIRPVTDCLPKMKGIRLILLLVALFAAGCASQPHHIQTSDLVGACSVGLLVGNPEDSFLEPALYAACYTYLAASLDAVYADVADKSGETPLPSVCIPKRPKLDTTKQIFMDYLRDNPDRAEALSSDTPYLAVVEALSQAFPCTKEQYPVFRDVALLKGSRRKINGSHQICIIESIEARHKLYPDSEASTDDLLAYVFYLNPGIRKLRVRCEIWRDETLEQHNSGPISFVAEPSNSYEPVRLPKVGEPNKYCLYIRNIETLELAGSACP